MASASVSATTSISCLFLISSLLLASWFSAIEAQSKPPIVNGLSWTFYKSSCPKVESIIKNELKKIFKKDVGQAAGLLRLHFHDCFVLGCDSSVLLDGSAGGPSEQSELPNLTLRKEAFKIVNDLRARIHKECGPVVSCSDIVAIAARDSVVLTGGPDYDVPLGRRDGVNFAEINATFEHLVGPQAKVDEILTKFARKRLDTTDAVSLSGGHTIGISHCTSFTERLYPTQDPTMDKTFANNLKRTCPKPDTVNTTNLDIRSPNKFDNKYYVDLMNRQGLFTSDQDLYTDKRTRSIVTSFAINQTLFFEKFVLGMIKMGQIEVLTGKQGEIRTNCSAMNSKRKHIAPVTEEEYIASVVNKENIAPVAEEKYIASVTEEKYKAPVAEEHIAPVAEEKYIASVTEEKYKAPVAEEHIAPVTKEEELDFGSSAEMR